MNASDIAQIFENIARLLELKGENPFKIRAYSRAAETLETFPGDLAAEIEKGGLASIDGIGKAIAEKITLLVHTGKLPYYDELRDEFPHDILELFEIQGLGAKKIKVLWEKLGVHSSTSLERACRSGKVESLPGFGAKTAANLLEGIDLLKRNAGAFLFSTAARLAEQMLEDLRAHPASGQVEVAGSYRRRKEVVRDLDLLVSSSKPEEISDFFVHHPLVERILAHGPTKSSVILDSGIQCDLRVVASKDFPFALNYFTGSKEHNVRIRGRALERGWSLNEYRFSRAENRELKSEIPPVEEEKDIYRALGLDFIPPELREDKGEVAAAEQGRLPRLIELSDLKGTLHNHTHESDGKATLEDMANAAADLGLQYLGIADHSKSSVQARGLDENRLRGQMKQIREWNASSSNGLTLLAGTECDILKDGSLDFDDELLSELDYVVISVHSSLQLDETAMTDRIIRAMQNPYATILAHPTGRILLRREAYAVNIPAILDAAAATGTIIELNATPQRLDLDWRWWPLAKEKGVKCMINPDAHSVSGLRNLAFGINIARKGWLTREDVVNCLPLAEFRNFLNS
jgi:DNA polymerase (family 10)